MSCRLAAKQVRHNCTTCQSPGCTTTTILSGIFICFSSLVPSPRSSAAPAAACYVTESNYGLLRPGTEGLKQRVVHNPLHELCTTLWAQVSKMSLESRHPTEDHHAPLLTRPAEIARKKQKQKETTTVMTSDGQKQQARRQARPQDPLRRVELLPVQCTYRCTL